MRVLIVTNMYPHDGMPYYGIFVREQEEAIRRWHPDVEFLIEYIDGVADKLDYLKSIPRIIKRIKKENIDLVHIHYGFSGLFLLAMHRCPVPVLVTLHGGDIQSEQGKYVQVFFTRMILKRANAAIILNEPMRSLVTPLVKVVFSIPCSVNTETFQPSHNRTETDHKLIVFPSDRNRWVKDYPLFEKVISELRSKYGLKCETSEVKGMSRVQVAALYQKADLMLMTSISEGSPQVVKEAMACNLPVVSTPVGDVAYLLDGVQDSFVASSRSPEELAHLCMKSLERTGSGVKGRQRITQLNLDDKNTAQQIYQIYQDLLQKK